MPLSYHFGLIKSNITLNQGGDTQAFSLNGNYMFMGSHANAWVYQDGLQWPTPVGYTRVDQFNWLGAFDAQTGTFVRDWVPQVATAYSEGTWGLFTDSRGCLWFGGDFNRGAFVGGVAQYLQGFSRFCQRDTTPPSVPTNVNVDLQAAGGPKISWSASTDNAAGFIGYEVLRDDQVVSNLVYGSSFVDTNAVAGSRYFVRAVDATGNRSATSAVKIAGADTTKPTVPTNLAATVQPDNSVVVTWTASTDNVGVTGYELLRNGTVIQTLGAVTTTTVTGLPGGTSYLQLRAFDAAGNRSSNTASVAVTIVGPDTTKPSVPTALAATVQPDSSVVLTWNASTDNVGVTGYEVLRNGTVIATTATPGATLTGQPVNANNYYQVRAFDAAGNRSNNTASVLVVIPGPDTVKPSVPTGFTVALQPDGSVVLAWTASSDNVGVTGYAVFDTGTEIRQVAGTGVTLAPVATGDHWYQVLAFDAAGNRSAKTASVKITR